MRRVLGNLSLWRYSGGVRSMAKGIMYIDGQIRMPHPIDPTKCIKCGACWGACPFGAIREE